MNILILEDEIPAYKKLVAYLENCLVENFKHDHVRSVKEGLKVLSSSTAYDLIISDIKLTDGVVFDVFNIVSMDAPIIFCTAYDEHLLNAFQTNGIAYILKPYSEEDLAIAIQKFKDLFQFKAHDQRIFEQFKTLLKEEEKHHKKRFAIKKNEGIKLLNVEDICLIDAFGDLCKLKDNKGRLHTISKNIGSIINELDPKYFFRINRSQIVNIGYIEKIEPYSKNRLSLKMKCQTGYVTTSSSTTKEFRQWIEQ